MKPSFGKTFHRDSAGGGEDYQFTLESDPLIMQRLSDQIYNRPIEAIVRELGTNAYDSHIDAGCTDRPFYVELPTQSNQNFKIRDYGTGLSKKDLVSLYTAYAKSTRRDSNDHVGSIGIGSKSPFAYTQQFTVISRHGGKKITALCFKDQNHMPTMRVLSEEDSSEESGLEVFFPVDSYDSSKFCEAAKRVYQWFDTKPKSLPEISYEGTISDSKIIADDDWFVSGVTNYEHIVVMGNVAYKLPYREWDVRGLVLYADIGDIDINISRESIQSNNRNLAWYSKKIQETKKKFQSKIKEEANKITTRYEAFAFASKCTARFGYNACQNITIQNTELNESIIGRKLPVSKSGAGFLSYVRPGAKQRSGKFKFFPAKDLVDTEVLWMDQKTKCVVGAGNYARGKNKPVLLLSGSVDEFCELTGYDKNKIKKASTFYVKPETKTGARYGHLDVLKLDPKKNGIQTSYWSRYWTATGNDPFQNPQPTDLYIVIDRYEAVAESRNITVQGLLRVLDLTKYTVYGVKVRAKQRAENSKMKSVEDFLNNLMPTQQDIDHYKYEKLNEVRMPHLTEIRRSIGKLPHKYEQFLAPIIHGIDAIKSTRAQQAQQAQPTYQIVKNKISTKDKKRVDTEIQALVNPLKPIIDGSHSHYSIINFLISQYSRLNGYAQGLIQPGIDQEIKKLGPL